MKFIELTVSTTSEAEELVSDLLWNYTNYGVAISDVKDVIELINGGKLGCGDIDKGITENPDEKRPVLIKTYIALDIAAETIAKIEKDLEDLRQRSKSFADCGTLEAVKRTVDGDEWIEIWKKHYRPIKINNVVICPEWIDRKIKDGEVTVKIDGNTAFGTGEHETTSMMTELLQEYLNPEMTVIDVGTGSGILGIAAAKLGAKEVIMTDIDYVAVKTASHNCEMNGTADKCKVALSNLLDDTSIKGDLVLANITADVLLILSESILKNIKDGGVMIMSGIIKSRIAEVIEKYESLGFMLLKRKDKGEWIAVSMLKGGDKK